MVDAGNARIAVLIDADNVSATRAGDVLAEVARYGASTVKRAYGDWSSDQLKGWKGHLNRYAIQPVQQFAYTKGKNSTDFALVIDAMDLLYAGNVDAFAIVSSDSDFTRLVTRLRESGSTVYGFGGQRTPMSLREACDSFVLLESLGGPGEPEPEVEEPVVDDDEPTPLPDLRPLLEAAVSATSQDDGWAALGAVGTYLKNRHSSFDARNYGSSRLVELAKAQDYLDVEQESGRAPRVRLHVPSKATTRTTTRKRSAGKKAAAPKA